MVLLGYGRSDPGRVDFQFNGNRIHSYPDRNEYINQGAPVDNNTLVGVVAMVSNINEIVGGINRVGPSDCVFGGNSDVVDEFSYINTQALDSRLLPQPTVAGETAQGTMDRGNDRDLFVVNLYNGAEYRINVNAIAPEDVNLETDKDGDGRQDADAITFSRDAEHTVDDPRELLGVITPRINVLDADGNVIASSVGEEHLTINPTSTGDHFVQVVRAGDMDVPVAGIYTVTIESLTEGEGDFVDNTNTGANLMRDSSMPASLTSGDTDWFRIKDLTIDELNTVVVSASESDPLSDPVMALYDSEGRMVDLDDYATGRTGRDGVFYQVLEFIPDEEQVYYVSVSSENGNVGGYTIQRPVVQDDNPTIGDDFYNTLKPGGTTSGGRGLRRTGWCVGQRPLRVNRHGRRQLARHRHSHGRLRLRRRLQSHR